MQSLKKTKKEILKNSIALLFYKKNGLSHTKLDSKFKDFIGDPLLDFDFVKIEDSLRSDLHLNFGNERHGNLLCDSFEKTNKENCRVNSDWFHELDLEEDSFYIEIVELKEMFDLIDNADSDKDLYKIVDDLFLRIDHKAEDFFERTEAEFMEGQEPPIPTEMLSCLQKVVDNLYTIRSSSSISFSKDIGTAIDSFEEVISSVEDFNDSYEKLNDDKDKALTIFNHKNKMMKDMFKSSIIDIPHLYISNTEDAQTLDGGALIEKNEDSEMFDLFLKNKDAIISILTMINQQKSLK